MQQIKPTDNKFQVLCKTFEGLEEVLAAEISEAGLTPEISRRAVLCEATYPQILLLNFTLRTALNVTIKVAEFTARTPDELAKKAFDINWPAFFNVNRTFSISHTVRSDYFTHTQFAALKLKDSIVDRFKKELHSRPSVDKENPDVVIHLRISGENVSLWFDTSGSPLYIRGYKRVNGPAPLNEVLAAGLIKLTGWDMKTPVYNPMCGGGTLGFEAFMMAFNIPVSFSRQQFAYHALPWFNAEDEIRIQKKINEQVREAPGFNVRFSDINTQAVEAARKSAKSFQGLGSPVMEFLQEDFFESTSKGDGSLILLNPPYGERMEQDDLIGFYKRIGDTLKHKYAGHTAWVLSAALEEIKHLGLRPSRKIKVFNGPLEARWQKYEMYSFDKKKFSE